MNIKTPFLILLSVLASPMLFAQDELNEDREIVEREVKAQSMSETVYKRVSAIHDLMGEGQNAEALKRAEDLEQKSRLNDYERAMVYQTIGFLHANENSIKKAISYFEKSIAENALTTQAQQGMLYSLASLYQAESQYRKAIDTAREWFRYEAEPKPDAYMLIGYSFAQLEEYRNALPYVQKAVALAPKPQESWYQLELAIYFETKQMAKAIPLLEKMIQLWPDKANYWETLSSTHMQLGHDRDALSTMMVAYRKGLVVKQDKIINLVRLNMFLEIPFTAGTILDEQLSAGVVERDKKHLEILQSAWTAAQEYDKALAVMAELGELTDDPKYAIDSAKIYNELARWEDVITSATTALDRGYDKRGEANLLIGTAYSELGRYRDSIAAFRAAEENGTAEERRNARAWIGFVNDRMKMDAPVASNNS